MKKTYLLVFLIWVLSACSWNNPVLLGESNFPLIKHITIPVKDEIREIAVAKNWVAVDVRDKIIAIDLKTHTTLWSREFSALTYATGLLTIDNTLIVASPDKIFAIDNNGQKKELVLDSDIKSITSLVSVYPDYLFFVGGPGWIFEAYDVSNGKLIWKTTAGRGGGDEAYYDYLSGLVYLSGGSVSAYDHKSGELKWEQNRNILCSAFDAGVIYEYEKVDNNGHYRVNAFDVKNQNDIWSREFKFQPASGVNKITIIDNLVVLSGSEIITLDKSNGNQIWKTSTGETFYTSPVYFDGYLFAKSGTNHTVYAISPFDGSIIGTVIWESNDLWRVDAIGGVYKIENGIMFNTRNSIEIYQGR
jgi:hypothetical protein